MNTATGAIISERPVRSLLHCGCGNVLLPDYLSEVYTETRLDVSLSVRADIHRSFVDLGDIGPFDAIFCSHALEHLAPQEVKNALLEFRRVLTEGGCAMIHVPDLQDIVPDDTVIYISAVGPITGRDMFYGHEPSIGENPYMLHKTGFMQKTLKSALEAAGFSKVIVNRLSNYQLFGAAIK